MIRDVFSEVWHVFLCSLKVYKNSGRKLVLPVLLIGIVSVFSDVFLSEDVGLIIMVPLMVLFLAGFAVARNVIKSVALGSYSPEMKRVLSAYKGSNVKVVLADVFVFGVSVVLFSVAGTFVIFEYIRGGMSREVAAQVLGFLMMFVLVFVTYAQKYANVAILVHGARNFLCGIYLGLQNLFSYWRFTSVLIFLQSALLCPMFLVVMKVTVVIKVLAGAYTVLVMPAFVIPTALLIARRKDEERGSVVFGGVVVFLVFVFVAFGYSVFFGEIFSGEMERVFSSLK
ncbi:MAG: hypothetical protein DRN71_02680 [Candidatus Nanohalarchaeota archaeon]|nr:MAG: hypothetical protein DRN71_02680 [Candidatus Nanohaloarchaeota archaeon]